MTDFLLVLAALALAGGFYLGSKYGRYVERKAQAVAAAVKKG